MYIVKHSDLKCPITFGNWFWHLTVGNRPIVLNFYQQRPVFALKNHPRPQRPKKPMKANKGQQSPKLQVYLLLRGSPDSTNFGSQDNRVIRGIVLIGDWFSTKNREIDKFDFQSPLFYTKKLIILFRNQFLMLLNTVGSKVLIFDC